MLVKHLTLNNCTTKDTDHLWLARETSNGPPFGSFSRDDDVKKMGGQKTKPMDPLLGPLFGLLSRDVKKYWGSWGMSPFLAGSRSPMTRGAQTQIIKQNTSSVNTIVERIATLHRPVKADRHANDTNTLRPPPPARVQRQGDQFQAIHQAVLTNLLARHMNHPPHPSSDTVTTYNINKAPFLNQGE